MCHNHEYNFVFEVESDILKVDYRIPQFEKHLELVWMPLDKLQEIEFRAEPLKELIPEWLRAKPAASVFRSVMV